MFMFSCAFAAAAATAMSVDASSAVVEERARGRAADRPVLYSGETSSGADLYTAGEDGQTRRLTQRESRGEYDPERSPDGSKTVFTTYRYGGWKLAVADANADNPRQLVRSGTGYQYQGTFSPDGSLIAFVAFESGNSGARQLYTVGVDGRGLKQLTTGDISHYNPVFSTDGTKILMHTRRTTPAFDIYQINLDGSGLARVTETDDRHEFAASLSPDGSRLAFHTIGVDRIVRLVVRDLQTGEETDLGVPESGLPNRSTPLNSYATSWSPDGSRLAFTILHEGDFEIFTVAPDGSDLKQLTDNDTIDVHPSW